MLDGKLSIGFLEPHLLPVGGIRRILEFSNRLVDRGHRVSIFVHDSARGSCSWMPCHARVRLLRRVVEDELDVVVFNHEPDWHLLAAFPNAQARVFYALAVGRLYGKEGSWEAVRANVDLVLANSTFTAEMIEQETGRRPEVVLGGLTDEYFHPVEVEKQYPILCVGDRRPWKGTEVVEEAARILGLPLERYGEKNIAQERLAEEYCRAEVFAVGSPVEGFGWPGLEALACGVPLVTTDNGGCREYAVHGETALVVPPNDSEAMAEAIAYLRWNPDVAANLARNGLALARERFNWTTATDELEAQLRAAVAGASLLRPNPERRVLPAREVVAPELSIVTPVWDQLAYTQAFAESVHRYTDVPYELIIIDNGSHWHAQNYAREAADVAILNDKNLGFAHAMNQGLAASRGRVVAFCNNDTVLPEHWASKLLAHLDDEGVGIVVPAITNANHDRTIRTEPGDSVERLAPFEPPPPAVIYVMRRDTIEALGRWGEEYEVASGEDTDLAFKVWVNGLDIVYDSRVLVEHVSKGTAKEKIDNWTALWRANREVFLEKWLHSADIPYIGYCTPAEFDRNLKIASAVTWWMGRYFHTRDRLQRERRKAVSAPVAAVAAPLAAVTAPVAAAMKPFRQRTLRRALACWRRIKPLVPRPVRDRLVARYHGRW